MKKALIFLTLILLISNTLLFAQNFKGKEEKVIIAPPQKNLTAGEILEYSVEWLGVPIGKIILTLEEAKGPEGQEFYHITGRSLPNKFFTRFYDVEYRWDSYVYRDTLEPYSLLKVRRINDDFLDIDVKFDRRTHTAKYYYVARGSSEEIVDFPTGKKIKASKSNKYSTVSYPDDIHDLLTTLYYFRLKDIKENSNYVLHVFYAASPWEIKVKVDKPYLKDIYKKGTFPVFSMNTNTELAYYILGKRGIKIYFTADPKRVPVLITFNSAIGQFRAVLQNLP